IAKVVPALRHDSRQIPIASDAPPRHTSRGFLHWRFADAGPVSAAPPSWGRHPQTFTEASVDTLTGQSPLLLKANMQAFANHFQLSHRCRWTPSALRLPRH